MKLTRTILITGTGSILSLLNIGMATSKKQSSHAKIYKNPLQLAKIQKEKSMPTKPKSYVSICLNGYKIKNRSTTMVLQKES